MKHFELLYFQLDKNRSHCREYWFAGSIIHYEFLLKEKKNDLIFNMDFRGNQTQNNLRMGMDKGNFNLMFAEKRYIYLIQLGRHDE